jgi:transcription antitermination factor NusG
METNWYAISAWASQLDGVLKELRSQRVDYYVPSETVERRVGRRMVVTNRPVWPGYVFLHCQPGAFGGVLCIDGVYDFIRGENREPVKLWADALVPVVLAEIFGDLDYTRNREVVYRPQRGDKVRIRSGKWKGYLGSVLSLSKRKALLETPWCKLEIEHDALEPIEAKAA